MQTLRRKNYMKYKYFVQKYHCISKFKFTNQDCNFIFYTMNRYPIDNAVLNIDDAKFSDHVQVKIR